jgi:para-aminobenzoate synthetase component 1
LSTNQISVSLLPLTSYTKAENIFASLAHLPWAFWLDSCQSQHPDCQFDIIVWQPSITLETSTNNTLLRYFDQSGKTTKELNSSEDPLFLLRKTQQDFFKKTVLPDSHLPFLGGALGSFSYDLGQYFECLPQIAKRDINLPDMAVGIYQQAIIVEHKTQKIWLVCMQDQQDYWLKWLTKKLTSAPSNKNKPSFAITSPWQANMDKQAYQEKFNQVQEYLLTGDCYQINLAQRFSAKYQGDEFKAYQALRKANNAPFSAFMRFRNNAILSISPERFLQVNENKQVQSKPIKGTRPRSSDAALDNQYAQALKSASKDQAENLMIVDLLRNDISKSCLPGSVKVPKLFAIESFPAVHHLVSTVEGKLTPKHDATDLLRGAFPGGSITGAPKIRAMEIIESLEPNQRSIYCGSIGYISACGKMDTNIAIRTLVCQQGNIYCWAGGGIVADSAVDSEYQETFDKVNKILPILSAYKSK